MTYKILIGVSKYPRRGEPYPTMSLINTWLSTALSKMLTGVAERKTYIDIF